MFDSQFHYCNITAHPSYIHSFMIIIVKLLYLSKRGCKRWITYRRITAALKIQIKLIRRVCINVMVIRSKQKQEKYTFFSSSLQSHLDILIQSLLHFQSEQLNLFNL
jgi:hypothetical protein